MVLGFEKRLLGTFVKLKFMGHKEIIVAMIFVDTLYSCCIIIMWWYFSKFVFMYRL